MNRRILVFGSGLLGKGIEKYLPNNFERRVVSHSECDIMDIEGVKRIVSEYNPNIIINTAAITNVDYCESHSQEAFMINSGGAGYLASVARDRGIKIVHISTDYVFDGKKDGKYLEEDEANPLSVYAQSKYEGEQLISFSGADYLIVRVQWLYGEFRDTFIDSAVKRILNNEKVDTIVDQYGSPTYVKYVVYGISRLLNVNFKGIVHIASEGICSRYEQLLYISELLNLNKSLINPTKWSDYLNRATRPRRIELSKERLFALTGYRMTEWKEETDEYITLKYGRKI